MVYADDVNVQVLCENINTNTIKKSTEALLGQSYNINIANKYLENMANFKYLETKETNQNCIHEEIKSGLNVGNACYHAI
jgi:hypothetical protein